MPATYASPLFPTDPRSTNGPAFRIAGSAMDNWAHYRAGDGLCHIDGLPCRRGGTCREPPGTTCEKWRGRDSLLFAAKGCGSCASRRKGCPGFRCLLEPRRQGGKTRLPDIPPPTQRGQSSDPGEKKT